MQVKCKNCGETFYETTEEYDPSKMVTGSMLRFVEKYGPDGFNWSLPFAEHDMAEAISCVDCGSPMAPNGYLIVEDTVLSQPDTPGCPQIDDQDQGQDEDTPEKTKEDVFLEKYFKQKSCPECGGFYSDEEWDRHIASHPKDVKDRWAKNKKRATA